MHVTHKCHGILAAGIFFLIGWVVATNAAASGAEAGSADPRGLEADASGLALRLSPVIHAGPSASVDVEPSTASQDRWLTILSEDFPVSFDLVANGCVTPVRTQAGSPSCWVFAAYGSLESTIRAAGGTEMDLSENHMKNWHGFDSGPNSGGNQFMAQAYLSRWDGPVREVDDPYHDLNDYPSPGGPPQCYVREVLEVNTAAEIKQCLMAYGAIAAGADMSHYDAASNTCYSAATGQPAHGVTIVGWDDNQTVPNAPGKGAWLLKNTWGPNWGDHGYFWLSYYDSCGAKNGFCFCDAVPPGIVQKVYYHDYYGNVSSVSCAYACNAFRATSEQELVAVQFWTKADGAGYEIRIYDGMTGGALTGQLRATAGSCAWAGLHTVDLPTPVHLTAGDDFYIYLHITDGGNFPQACDTAVAGYTQSCTAAPGQGYFSFNGVTWADLTTALATAHFCIKGLATTTTPPEITVLGRGVSIQNGAMTPKPADDTFFGDVRQGDPPVSRTFTIYNDGTGTLALGAVTVPQGFTVTHRPPATLARGTSGTLTVRLDTDAVGTKSGHIVIANDDSDEHPFHFAVLGTVAEQTEVSVGDN